MLMAHHGGCYWIPVMTNTSYFICQVLKQCWYKLGTATNICTTLSLWKYVANYDQQNVPGASLYL